MLQRIKELEHQGFQFEAAEGSFEMLLRRAAPGYGRRSRWRISRSSSRSAGAPAAGRQATVKMRVGDESMHTAAEGDGPVNALDRAVRKALVPHYPGLAEVHLVDYKVRIVDEHLGTGGPATGDHRVGPGRRPVEHRRLLGEHHRGKLAGPV